MLSYIAASTAKQIDVRLYELGFTRSLLIELAGQSVAYSILSVYPPTQFPNACIFIGTI